jgi:hypothetical protein
LAATEEILAHQKCDQISFDHLPHVMLHSVLIAAVLRAYYHAVQKGQNSYYEAVRGQMQTSGVLLILDQGIFEFDRFSKYGAGQACRCSLHDSLERGFTLA